MRRPVGKGRDAACLSCPAASSGWPSPRALASDAPFCWQMSRRVMRMAGIKVVLKESAPGTEKACNSCFAFDRAAKQAGACSG